MGRDYRPAPFDPNLFKAGGSMFRGIDCYIILSILFVCGFTPILTVFIFIIYPLFLFLPLVFLLLLLQHLRLLLLDEKSEREE